MDDGLSLPVCSGISAVTPQVSECTSRRPWYLDKANMSSSCERLVFLGLCFISSWTIFKSDHDLLLLELITQLIIDDYYGYIGFYLCFGLLLDLKVLHSFFCEIWPQRTRYCSEGKRHSHDSLGQCWHSPGFQQNQRVQPTRPQLNLMPPTHTEGKRHVSNFFSNGQNSKIKN